MTLQIRDTIKDVTVNVFNCLSFVRRNGIVTGEDMRIARKIPMQMPSSLTGVNLHVSNSVFSISTNRKNGDMMNQKPVIYVSFLPSSQKNSSGPIK